MNDNNEYNERPKLSHSSLKKALNRDLKLFKESSQELRDKKLQEAAELERLQEIVNSLQQEKDKIDQKFESDIQFASIEIKLHEGGKFPVHPNIVENAKNKVEALTTEYNSKIQEIDSKIAKAEGDVKHQEAAIKKGTNTNYLQEEFSGIKNETFKDFQDYMLSSSQFKALVKKAESIGEKGVSTMDLVSMSKHRILDNCLEALKNAKDFGAWKEAIDDMKEALKNPDLSERRTKGMGFFDHLTERSTKNLMKDFLDYNESKHDDLWYRSGAQAGPSKW